MSDFEISWSDFLLGSTANLSTDKQGKTEIVSSKLVKYVELDLNKK